MAHFENKNLPMNVMAQYFMNMGKKIKNFPKSEASDKAAEIHDSLKQLVWTIASAVEIAKTKGKNIPVQTIDSWKDQLTEKITVSKNAYMFAGGKDLDDLVDNECGLLQDMATRMEEYKTAAASGKSISDVEAEKMTLLKEYNNHAEQDRINAEKKQEAEHEKFMRDMKAVKVKVDLRDVNVRLSKKNFIEPLVSCENNLAETNSFFRFTKQSNQFRDFRTVIERLNQELKNSKGKITSKNVEKIAKIVIAAEHCDKKYDAHCRKHFMDNNQVRADRVRCISDTMNLINKLSDIKEVKEAKEKVLDETSLKFDGKTKEDKITDGILNQKNLQFLDSYFEM